MEELKSELSPEAFENLNKWMTKPSLSSFRDEINVLIENKNVAELEDAFYKHIEIGTGGIRGQIGPGPNRINLRTIGEAAQGLAQFIEDFGEEAKKKGVVVGHEARKMSRPFAQLCCSVFAANGIKSYLFDGMRSTPEVSFAVRYLGATAGVQLTASHNPRNDNGFKFYWSDGGQVVPPADLKFMQLVANVTKIKDLGFEQAVKDGLIEPIGTAVDQEYFNAVRALSLNRDRTAKVVYSPIHGAGSTNAIPILKQEGFDVTVVPEQYEPDENFPTATGDLINPEYREVMELPIKLAEKIGADVAINSDPDADRIGVAAKKRLGQNEVLFLTGNEVGVALVHFILTKLKEKNKLTQNSLILETYVTTSLISEIAKSFGIKVIDNLLVGFKFIGEIIENLENKEDFVFAAEESLGYLRGSFVRDKDAAIASFTLAELVSELKSQEKTLINYLDDIYKQFGYYKNILNMVEMRGRVGFENRDKIMRSLRANSPKQFAGLPVLKILDRLPEEFRKPENYKCGATGDQITFILNSDGKTKLTARPSGTEPKIKYYVQHWAKVDKGLEETRKQVDEIAVTIERDIIQEQERIINA